jgi:ABC-type transport system involved in multi-copper enzyme maturation permease subunit
MARLTGLALFAFAYAILLEVMLAAAILFWPEFAANLATLRSMTSAIPIAGEMLSKVEEQGLPAYILAQHFFKGCNALGTAAAVLFAAPAVAGEAHRGTLEMWLARPFSRRRLLLERYAAGALALVVPVFLTTLTIPWLCTRVDEVEPYSPYLACAALQGLFLLAIYGVTFLCSCAGSNPTKIALTLLFVTVFQFALYMIKTVTHWSLYRLCDMDVLLDLFDDGRWNASILVSLAVTVAATLVASLIVFERRTP